ncbi:hypothetical protein [Rathayibacter iranicus]|uniref:hypothetical protein n=1 Tax=Rathayibacter iranicus TaxID=59737 RepID=UPI0013268441|nr:hypothetical protein [Rathayibacter iranicus]MWV32559.1 hypothetical protein [Rathayibacter iranicus NCPPB 2253 = VKM Ac-1602]
MTAEAEWKRTEDALWGLMWDGLQVVAGAVVTAVGIGAAPFTGGLSLGFSALGGSLMVGGVNSAINHVTIATVGMEGNGTGLGRCSPWRPPTRRH